MVTLASIKLNNNYTYINAVAPTTAAKTPLYVSGETWLDSVTGYSYQLVDDVLGTWKQIETANDYRLSALIKTFPEMIFKTINNYFEICSGITGTFSFTGKTATFDDTEFYEGLIDNLYADDIVRIHSNRNNGFFTISTNAANVITFDEDVKTETAVMASIFTTEIPDMIYQIMAKMLWFDEYKRNNNGMQSETIGTYSYTKAISTNGLNYPDEIAGGLSTYAIIAGGGSCR